MDNAYSDIICTSDKLVEYIVFGDESTWIIGQGHHGYLFSW